MLWAIRRVDPAFIAAFEDAGEPDQKAISAYLAKTPIRQHVQRHQGVKRWYYLRKGDPSIRLSTLGRPLQEFRECAVGILLGTNEIIGECAGNRHLAGERGFQLTLKPATWFRAEPDQTFATASQALDAISEQVRDLVKIERSQRRIRNRYITWKRSEN